MDALATAWTALLVYMLVAYALFRFPTLVHRAPRALAYPFVVLCTPLDWREIGAKLDRPASAHEPRGDRAARQARGTAHARRGRGSPGEGEEEGEELLRVRVDEAVHPALSHMLHLSELAIPGLVFHLPVRAAATRAGGAVHGDALPSSLVLVDCPGQLPLESVLSTLPHHPFHLTLPPDAATAECVAATVRTARAAHRVSWGAPRGGLRFPASVLRRVAPEIPVAAPLTLTALLPLLLVCGVLPFLPLRTPTILYAPLVVRGAGWRVRVGGLFGPALRHAKQRGMVVVGCEWRVDRAWTAVPAMEPANTHERFLEAKWNGCSAVLTAQPVRLHAFCEALDQSPFVNRKSD